MIYKIRSTAPSERYILAQYNKSELLVGFKLFGAAWTDEMVHFVHRSVPLKVEDFGAYMKKYKIIIEKYKK